MVFYEQAGIFKEENGPETTAGKNGGHFLFSFLRRRGIISINANAGSARTGRKGRERTLSREDIFHGRVITVHVDTVELPNGAASTREVADHPGGVAVLPLDGENNVLAVTQYRYVFQRPMLEIPAGKLEYGEDPYQAGLRELKEETGAVPGRYESLGKLIPSPGCYGETLYLYLARDLQMSEQHLDPDEFLNVERIPFAEMVRRCLSGEIEDAKTLVAVLKAKALLGL